jgi:hypothetical protein
MWWDWVCIAMCHLIEFFQGWDQKERRVFFTKNGLTLGPAFENVTGYYYPVIGLHTLDAKVCPLSIVADRSLGESQFWTRAFQICPQVSCSLLCTNVETNHLPVVCVGIFFKEKYYLAGRRKETLDNFYPMNYLHFLFLLFLSGWTFGDPFLQGDADVLLLNISNSVQNFQGMINSSYCWAGPIVATDSEQFTCTVRGIGRVVHSEFT